MKKPAKSKKVTRSAKRTEGAVKPVEETETANTSAQVAAPPGPGGSRSRGSVT